MDLLQVLMGQRLSEDSERRHIWLNSGCPEGAYIYGSLQKSIREIAAIIEEQEGE